jgi:TRAP-type C4-dicarboxylate transport system permease small subunit
MIIKFFQKLISVVENVLIVMFAIMALLVFGNVVLRYGFNSGIVFSEEVSRFLFMWITLIGALIVLREHGHLGVTSFVEKLGERGQRVCRFLSDSLTFICCVMLVHGTWKQVIIGMDDLAPVTGIPMGYVQSSLLISSVGMVMFLGHSLWRQLTGRMRREELVPHAQPSPDEIEKTGGDE